MDLSKKKILFISTKNLDYIRNTQELSLLQQNACSCNIIGSYSSHYIARLTRVFGRLLFTSCHKYDMVFLGFSPQLILPFFYWKFRHSEIIIDFFISVYDTMVYDRKVFRAGGIMARLCKWLDTVTLQKANFILSDTNTHGDYFSEEFGVRRDKIHTLYLVADPRIYYPRPQKKEPHLRGKYIVLYFGSALPLQGIDVILDAADRLRGEDRIQFIIIGPIGRKYDKPKKANIDYYEWLSQNDLANKIAEADLCLAGHFNAHNTKAKRTIPGKAFIYQAMGKPMILGDNPATHEMCALQNAECHYVEMGSPDALSEKILALYQKALKETKLL